LEYHKKEGKKKRVGFSGTGCTKDGHLVTSHPRHSFFLLLFAAIRLPSSRGVRGDAVRGAGTKLEIQIPSKHRVTLTGRLGSLRRKKRETREPATLHQRKGSASRLCREPGKLTRLDLVRCCFPGFTAPFKMRPLGSTGYSNPGTEATSNFGGDQKAVG